MKRQQLKIPDLAPRCINPRCNKPMQGKRPHAKTCSPACRKALWRYSPTPKHVKAKEVKPITSNGQKEVKRPARPRVKKGER